MLKGGVAILDEGNRMSEKSWASLAPLLDARRTVESIVAGVKIRAHPDFRFVTTMNDDASTFELPDYVNSRLTPTILVDFPEEEEELAILAENLPFAPEALLRWVTRFLKSAHEADEPFSVRDGINVARYALKRLSQGGGEPVARLLEAVRFVLGEEATVHAPPTGDDSPSHPPGPHRV
jgi:MoxR-like ATPase